MQESLEKLESEWSGKLRAVEYVGEIALDKEKFHDCCSLMASHIEQNRRCDFPVVLTVLAVNCMYFYYDESGFWTHFCDRLGVSNVLDWQGYLGRKIEHCLLSGGFLKESRWGGFRYVGPILEQCGVTRRYLPKLCDIMVGMGGPVGWDRLSAMPFAEYHNRMSGQTMSPYLAKFLVSESGWEFVRDLSKTLAQLSTHILDESTLSSLPGYRPDFWTELLALLIWKKQRKRGRIENLPPLPRFVFDPIHGHMAILFDCDYVRSHSYSLDTEPVTEPLRPLKRREDFKECFHIGLRHNEGGWRYRELEGWLPEADSCALFSPSKGLLKVSERLDAGNYYLILPSAVEVPSKLIVDYLGRFQIDTDAFRAWEISIESSHDLNFLPFVKEEKAPKTRFLSWKTYANKLSGQCDLQEVFMGHLPVVKIHHAELFRSHALALVVQVGEAVETQNVQGNSPEAELHLAPSVPSKGEIWVETLGRHREFSGKTIIDRLSFCVIPECFIEWPSGLYTIEDKPLVRLVSDHPIEAHFSNCTPIDNSFRCWEVPPKQNFLEGTLKAGPVSVRLAHPVFRANVFFPEYPAATWIDSQDLLDGVRLLFRGLPSVSAEVALALPNGSSIQLGELGRFDARGQIEASSVAFRDRLMSFQHPAARFALRHSSRLFETDKVVLNVAAVKNSIVYDRAEPNWADLLSPEMSHALKQISDILGQKISQASLDLCDHVSNRLADWTREILLCAVEFDGLLLQDSPEEIERQMKRDSLLSARMIWLRSAKAFLDSNQLKAGATPCEALLLEWPNLGWTPLVPKWGEACESILERLKQESDLEYLLREWADHVMGVRFHSILAKRPSGARLTSAWKLYQARNYEKAFKISADIIGGGAYSPILELAILLQCIVLLRNGRFEKPHIPKILQKNRRLWPHVEALLQIIELITGETRHVKGPPLEGTFPPQLLPLRSEDLALLNDSLRDPTDKQFSESKVRQDWLWMLAVFCVSTCIGNSELSKHLQSSLQKCFISDGIRERILRILDRGKHELELTDDQTRPRNCERASRRGQEDSRREEGTS